MAILTELFLVLAGFDSGISQSENIHPAELETFNQARKFGEKVKSLREATSNIPHPICRVLKQEIIVKYLEALTRLEALVMSELLGASSLPLTDSLRFSATIMSQSVDEWQERFDFGLEFMAKFDLDFEEYYSWLLEFTNKNAGYKNLRELSQKCQVELDKHWVSELRGCILGETRHLDLHPALEGHVEIIEDVRHTLNQLKEAAFRDLRVLDLTVELMKAIAASITSQIPSDAITTALSFPLNSGELHLVLAECQQNVSKAITSHLISSEEVQCLLTLLRDVVLCGSSLFEHCLADFDGDVAKALDTYFDQVDPQSIVGLNQDLCRSLIVVSDNRLRINLDSDSPSQFTSENSSTRFLRILISRDQCILYESVFEWLSQLVVARSRIPVGAGLIAWKYNLFHTELWGYYQVCLDEAMEKIKKVMGSDRGLNIRREDDQILHDLVNRMFLSSPEFIKLLKEVTTSDFTSLKLLSDIVNTLSRFQGHTLNLKPFQNMS